jgi:hypothetical protein
MNKNYSNILMVTMLSLAAYNGLMPAEQPKKSCIDPQKHTLKALAVNYIMANIALYGGTTAMSTIVTSALGSVPLRNSAKQVIKMSWDGSKKIKVPLLAAPLAVGYHTIQRNLAE